MQPKDRFPHIDCAASVQPYRLGADFEKSILWAIDELTNVNKHRRILLTSLMAGKAQRENFIERDGETWYHAGPGPTPVFDNETQFGPFPIIDGKIHLNTQLVAALAFTESTACGMEISLCLNGWSYFIREKVMPTFEKYFDE